MINSCVFACTSLFYVLLSGWHELGVFAGSGQSGACIRLVCFGRYFMVVSHHFYLRYCIQGTKIIMPVVITEKHIVMKLVVSVDMLERAGGGDILVVRVDVILTDKWKVLNNSINLSVLGKQWKTSGNIYYKKQTLSQTKQTNNNEWYDFNWKKFHTCNLFILCSNYEW